MPTWTLYKRRSLATQSHLGLILWLLKLWVVFSVSGAPWLLQVDQIGVLDKIQPKILVQPPKHLHPLLKLLMTSLVTDIISPKKHFINQHIVIIVQTCFGVWLVRDTFVKVRNINLLHHFNYFINFLFLKPLTLLKISLMDLKHFNWMLFIIKVQLNALNY